LTNLIGKFEELNLIWVFGLYDPARPEQIKRSFDRNKKKALSRRKELIY
jgi:hypothetical protein